MTQQPDTRAMPNGTERRAPMNRLTVTLCGSTSRAAHDLARVHRALALAGHLVHAPVPALPGEPPATGEQLANLTARHHAAIERSDLVIGVVNDGQVGESTADEVHRAASRGKPTRVTMYADEIDLLIADITAGRLGPSPADAYAGSQTTPGVAFVAATYTTHGTRPA